MKATLKSTVLEILDQSKETGIVVDFECVDTDLCYELNLCVNQDGTMVVDREKRIDLAMLITEHGVEIAEVVKLMTWKDFEGLVASILSENSFACTESFRRRGTSDVKGMEIDVIGIRGHMSLSVDAKMWSVRGGKASALRTAAEKQKERTFRLTSQLPQLSKKIPSMMKGLYTIIPVMVTWLVEEVELHEGVPVVPVFKLNSFIQDFEMFEDFSSLLPNRIDLEDIIRANKRAEGYKAAINFLTITGLEYSFFQQPSSRILKQKIENLNGELTLNFQDFWRQNVGKKNKIKINFELSHYDHTNPEKSGKPFLEFWIKDEQERLYPKQRSRGVRWFLSFFLELKATAMDKSKHDKVLLIDEPAVSLHARAQEDVLKVFDDIKERIQIIYTTHSPHLIDVNKLYRILAVQRAIQDDMKSETLVYSARSLKSATADTLSPIYSTMGARLSQQEIIKSFNNVIVKDLATYYFMKAIVALTGFEKECYFLPASGAESIPMMVNILMGWGIDYIILNFGNSEERLVHEKLMKEQYNNKIDLANKQMLFLEDHPDTEDLFSTIDFKKYVVKVREGITVRNSEYLIDNNYSRAILASNFLQEVTSENVSFKTLDDETRDNLNNFIQQLSVLLK